MSQGSEDVNQEEDTPNWLSSGAPALVIESALARTLAPQLLLPASTHPSPKRSTVGAMSLEGEQKSLWHDRCVEGFILCCLGIAYCVKAELRP